MKIIISLVLCFITLATSAKLDSTYLPPNSAKTAGGNGNLLNAPIIETQSSPVFDQVASPARGTGHQSNYQRFNNQEVHSAPSPVYGPASSNFPSSLNHPQTHSAPSPVYGPASNFQRSNNPEARANLIKFDNSNDGTGNYHFDFETENRIQQEEHGQLKQINDGEAVVVQGSYSYVGDDGKTYTVTYIADENGFQPSGEHINEEIVKGASEAARLAVHDGSFNGNGRNANVNGGYQY